MPIEVTCELCFRDHKVKSEFAGKTFKCKGCGEPLTVPKPKRRSKPTAPVEDDDFLGALDGAAKDRGQSLPPKMTSRKPKKTAGSSSAKKTKQPASSGMDDGNMKAIMGGVGTVLLLLLAVGLKLANKTDILDRLIPAEKGWIQFKLNGNNLSLDLPSTPNLKVNNIPNAVTNRTYHLEHEKFVVTVGYAQYRISKTSKSERSFSINEMKTDLLQKLMSEHPGTILEREEKLLIDGIPVYLFVSNFTLDKKKMRWYRYYLLAGDTFYNIEFIESSEIPQDSDREHIVNSIQFSDNVKFAYHDWQGKFENTGVTAPENKEWNAEEQESPEPSKAINI